MLPTRQRSHSTNLRVHHIHQTLPARITKHSPLHMCRLELTAAHLDLSVLTDQALGDIEGVAIVFGEAEGHHDFGLCRSALDRVHFGGSKAQGVFDVLDRQRWVDGSTPICCQL